MDVVELERLDVALGLVAGAGVLPGRDVAEVLVVAFRFAVFGLVLLAEMAAAALGALERVEAQQLAHREVVGHAAGPPERLVQLLLAAEHVDVLPELLAQDRNLLQRRLEPRLVASHPAILPEQLPEVAVEVVDRALTLDAEQLA